MSDGRFGDWTRAPGTWRGYTPDYHDHQIPGLCKRKIFRCLNVGTRLRSLTISHVQQAFEEAEITGSSILAFANHDYRDMAPDVNQVRGMLRQVRKKFPTVKIKFSGAEEAARALDGKSLEIAPSLSISLIDNRIIIKLVDGEIFGPQPFLAIKTKEGHYYHDNLDGLIPKKQLSYVFDEQTLFIDRIRSVGVGSAGRYGKYSVEVLNLK